MKKVTIRTIIIFQFLVMSFLPFSLGFANSYRTQSEKYFAPNLENNDPYPYITILESSSEGLTLEFKPPVPALEKQVIEGKTCQAITISGLYNSRLNGSPSLPVQGVMLGIPLDAEVTVEILETDYQSMPGQISICPTAQPVINSPTEHSNEEFDFTFQFVYYPKQNQFFPREEADLVETGMIRSQRYALIHLNPIQYNSYSGEMRMINRLILKISYHSSIQGKTNNSEDLREMHFEDSLRDLLLNYDQSKLWRETKTAQELTQDTIDEDVDYYKVHVDQDGIYKLSYDDLDDESIDVDSINPLTFQLYNQTTEVAIYVDGEDNSVFESGEYLLFYGEKMDSKYTDTNVYWLRWGVEDGLRMAEVNSHPTGSTSVPSEFLNKLHLEKDTKYYSVASNGVEKDHWYWDGYKYLGNPGEYTFDLWHLSTEAHTITLHGMIEPFYTIDTPSVEVYINGNATPIFDDAIAADPAVSFEANLQQSDLLEGENVIKIEIPNGNHIILTNWFEIEYFDTFVAENNQLVFDADLSLTPEFEVQGFSQDLIESFDISDPMNPIRLTDPIILPDISVYSFIFEPNLSGERRFLVQAVDQHKTPTDIQVDMPSNWQTTENGSDYIIISHADFLDPANELADYRRSLGYQVKVVDIQDIYDEFTGGIFTPDAIKLFLTYAYDYWVPQPSFVLLVGDGHYDYKDILGYGSQNFLPPFLDDVDPDDSERPTDNWYASVSGDDILPDLYIGRFPVNTLSEAHSMVQKTIQYEQSPTDGDWTTAVTFIADDPDAGGPFHSDSDSLADMLPSDYTVTKIYYGEEPYTSASVTETAISNAFNEGRLILHYAGHGDTLGWASPHIFEVDTLEDLNNGSKQPFMMPMTCAEGYFVYPNQSKSSLGESIVRTVDGGAVGSWSPSGNGFHNGHMILSEDFLDNLFYHGQNQLGFLTTEAKYHLHLSGVGFSDLIETYHLFGDPALRLETAGENNLYLPIIYH